MSNPTRLERPTPTLYTEVFNQPTTRTQCTVLLLLNHLQEALDIGDTPKLTKRFLLSRYSSFLLKWGRSTLLQGRLRCMYGWRLVRLLHWLGLPFSWRILEKSMPCRLFHIGLTTTALSLLIVLLYPSLLYSRSVLFSSLSEKIL